MMHMRAAQVQKQVWHTPRHDQNDQRPRRDKCQKKCDERQPGQMSRRVRR